MTTQSTRQRNDTAFECPICFKSLQKASYSANDFQNHVMRCMNAVADCSADFQKKKSQKLQRQTTKIISTNDDHEKDIAYREIMSNPKYKTAYEFLLLKYTDPDST